LEVLDLWPYKAGLKEQVGAIERELTAPNAKLAIRAAIGAGRHSVVKLLSSSMDLAVIDFPSFEDLDAPLHGLVQLASQAGTLDTLLQVTGDDLLKKTEFSARALADANRPLVVLMPVPSPGTPRETDAATRDRIEQMLAVLVNVPPLRMAVLATPGTRLRDSFTKTMELFAPKIGAPQINANALPGEFGAAAHALAMWMARTGWASTPVEARL
jgi:hypothetical protein